MYELRWPGLVTAIAATFACSVAGPAPVEAESDAPESPDIGEPEPPPEPPPAPPAYEQWVKIELPETYCSDGSQYKFFVNWREHAEDLLVIFEPGGACWDYASCSGELGTLGASNRHGIPDDHMNTWALHSPLVRRDTEQNPMRTWNMVFVPYCTGDIHTGSATRVYTNAQATGQLTYRHVGHDNLLAVSDWLGWQFPATDRMYVGGCSAGGAGSNINYYFLREAIAPNRGYLLNDAGPLFPNSVNSAPLHAQTYESWGIADAVADTPFAAALSEDFGSINADLAELYPADRLAISYFVRDYHYARYSYERFYEGIDEDGLHYKFWEDTLLLMDQYDAIDNLAYFLPYYRTLQKSHCASIVSFSETDIGEWQLGDFIELILDDESPLRSFVDPDGTLGP